MVKVNPLTFNQNIPEIHILGVWFIALTISKKQSARPYSRIKSCAHLYPPFLSSFLWYGTLNWAEIFGGIFSKWKQNCFKILQTRNRKITFFIELLTHPKYLYPGPISEFHILPGVQSAGVDTFSLLIQPRPPSFCFSCWLNFGSHLSPKA